LHGEALSRATLEYVFAVVESKLKEADWDQGRYLDLAKKVQNMGLWVLNHRTRETEQSVRDALDDENFSSADYAALRDYPARLARVEAAARALNDAGREAKSAEPRGGIGGFGLGNVVPDFFRKFVNEAADDARDAVARLSGLISSQQIVLSQRQALETTRFQRVVTIVGTAVLVPGLVAAIFGANVGFQGRESSQAFWAMLLLMAGSGIGSYVVIRSLETGAWGVAYAAPANVLVQRFVCGGTFGHPCRGGPLGAGHRHRSHGRQHQSRRPINELGSSRSRRSARPLLEGS
jgi:hypothetical protein